MQGVVDNKCPYDMTLKWRQPQHAVVERSPTVQNLQCHQQKTYSSGVNYFDPENLNDNINFYQVNEDSFSDCFEDHQESNGRLDDKLSCFSFKDS